MRVIYRFMYVNEVLVVRKSREKISSEIPAKKLDESRKHVGRGKTCIALRGPRKTGSLLRVLWD